MAPSKAEMAASGDTSRDTPMADGDSIARNRNIEHVDDSMAVSGRNALFSPGQESL